VLTKLNQTEKIWDGIFEVHLSHRLEIVREWLGKHDDENLINIIDDELDSILKSEGWTK